MFNGLCKSIFILHDKWGIKITRKQISRRGRSDLARYTLDTYPWLAVIYWNKPLNKPLNKLPFFIFYQILSVVFLTKFVDCSFIKCWFCMWQSSLKLKLKLLLNGLPIYYWMQWMGMTYLIGKLITWFVVENCHSLLLIISGFLNWKI